MKERLILLVEDNPDDEDLTLRCFKDSLIANRVVVARDGVEALDILFGRGPEHEGTGPLLPQVVLLDLKLPKLDGLEVLREIRAHPATRRLPVVILTSSVEDQDRISAYELGVNSYVRKPVDFAEFAEAARQLGLYWLVLNQAAPVAS